MVRMLWVAIILHLLTGFYEAGDLEFGKAYFNLGMAVFWLFTVEVWLADIRHFWRWLKVAITHQVNRRGVDYGSDGD